MLQLPYAPTPEIAIIANSPVYHLRIAPFLKRQIDAHRGREPLSVWLREAATQRLEAEQGLGRAFRQTLGEHTKQLRGLGINLNQLAHRANEGRAVTVDPALLAEIRDQLRASRTLLAEIKARLPE